MTVLRLVRAVLSRHGYDFNVQQPTINQEDVSALVKKAGNGLRKCFDMYLERFEHGSLTVDCYQFKEYMRMLEDTRLACRRVPIRHTPTEAGPFELISPRCQKDFSGDGFLLLGEFVPAHNTYTISAQMFPGKADLHSLSAFFDFISEGLGCDCLCNNWDDWPDELKETRLYKLARTAYPKASIHLMDDAVYCDINTHHSGCRCTPRPDVNHLEW